MDPEILNGIDDFIGEEIYSKLEDDEKKMMKVACLFDGPFEPDALFIEEDLTFDTLLALRNKSLMRTVADGRYLAHEVIRSYFRGILTPTEKERFSCGVMPYLLEQGNKAKMSYRNDDAVGYFSNALELQVDDGGKLEAMEGLGGVLELIGQYDGSLDRYQSVLELSPEARISSRVLRKIGRVHLLRGEGETALESFEKARELLDDEKSVEAGKLLVAFSQALHRTREWEESKKAANEAIKTLELHSGQENEIGKAHSILGLSYIFGVPPDFSRAEEHLLRSLDLRRKAGSLDGEAATQNNLGIAYANLSKPRKALEHLSAGGRLAEETGSFYTASKLTLTRGCLHYELLGEFDEALELFKNGLGIAEDAGDRGIQCLAHRHLSRACRYKGDLESSLEHSSKYVELAEKTGRKWDTMNAHLERAKEFLVLERFKDSAVSCKMARGMAERMDDIAILADCLRIEGGYLRGQGRLAESRKALDKSIELLRKTEDTHALALAYCEYALLCRDEGDRRKSEEHVNHAVKLLESENISWLADSIKAAFTARGP
ncbi:MAG: tetratricopeptide repeat protein [Candidatus Thermoplasmatota archaeon]|nr:tetratricopeptide repeat protein [Candidatus Thermoplasmatota archaeon]